jgi:hypothetical protein
MRRNLFVKLMSARLMQKSYSKRPNTGIIQQALLDWPINYIKIRSHCATAASQGSRGRHEPMSYVWATIDLSHQMERNPSNHPISQQRQETCFSRRRNFTVAKKDIETCFSAWKNLTATKKTCKHIFASTKFYYGPNQILHLAWTDV